MAGNQTQPGSKELSNQGISPTDRLAQRQAAAVSLSQAKRCLLLQENNVKGNFYFLTEESDLAVRNQR